MKMQGILATMLDKILTRAWLLFFDLLILRSSNL